MKFKQVKIEDVADVTKLAGFEFTKYIKYNKTGEIIALRAINIRNNTLDLTDIKRIDKSVSESLTRSKLYKDDIILTYTGNGYGAAAIIDENDKYHLAPNICKITPKEINPYYLYKYITSNKFQKEISNNVGGSGQPTIPMKAIRALPISVPNRDNQNKIAKILKSIDDKIKLNNEINNNLHELINQQYSKYLKENDDFEELDIKDIFEFEAGIEPGSKNYLENIESDTIYFYRVGDMNSECRTFIKRDLAKEKYITENDIVVSFDATIGRIGYGLNGSYSTGMKKVSVKDKNKDVMDNSIVYAYFNNNEVQNIMKENARGTTILHASSSIDFMKFKYNKLLLKKYSRIISISFEKMKNIKKGNAKLLELRDVLLPRLINGEIDLDKIDI